MCLVYVNQGKIKETLSMDLESLQMKRPIYVHDKAYPEIAASLSNIALLCKGRGWLIERIQFFEECPVMQRIIRVPDTSHPCSLTMLALSDRVKWLTLR